MVNLYALVVSTAYAQAPTLEDAPVAAPSSADFLIPNLLLIVALIGIFVLMVYLPQKRRNKEHSEMLDHLRKGDKIVTTGGMVGKVAKTPGDIEILIETGDGNKVTILRAAITGKYDDVIGNQPPLANENSRGQKENPENDDKDADKNEKEA